MSTEWKRLVAMRCDAPEGCSAELDAGDGVWLYDTEEQARSAAWDADWATDGNGHDYCEQHRELAVEGCATPGCSGDWRYAAPGRGHITGCRWPLNMDELESVVVDDAMIGRALRGDEPGAGGMTVRRMRKILTAALTPDGQEGEHG